MPSLNDIGLVLLKKVFKGLQCIFTFCFWISLQKDVAFIKTHLNSHYPRMVKLIQCFGGKTCFSNQTNAVSHCFSIISSKKKVWPFFSTKLNSLVTNFVESYNNYIFKTNNVFIQIIKLLIISFHCNNKIVSDFLQFQFSPGRHETLNVWRGQLDAIVISLRVY